MYTVKIRNEDTADGAIFGAKTALCTKGIIYNREVIFDLNRARGAILFTLFAADAGVRAFSASGRALFLITAGNEKIFLICHKSYKMLRAGSGTNTATDAKPSIDMSNTVLQANSVLRTSLYAIAKANATEVALSVSAVHGFCRAAAADTDVIHLIYGMIAVAVAMDNGNLLDNVLSFLPENIGDLLCHCIRSGNTKICFYRIILSKSLCVSVTPRVTASAAICSGQALTYIRKTFILGDRKEFRGKNKHYSTDKSYSRNYQGSY